MIEEGKKEGWLQLPVSALPAWASFNDATFNGVTIGPQPGLEDRGSTVVAHQTLKADLENACVLMTVPRDLILSVEKVQEHARYDRDFRQVLEALGEFGRTSRGAILLFLLMQSSLACPDMPEKRGVTSAFSEYIKFLPQELLPTMWTEDERALLLGTTLGPAVTAKLHALYREFDSLRDATGNIDWCAKCWWDEVDGIVSFNDWLQVDAMYRSRALEFPGIGDCMAPCIDMANHASGKGTKAIYEVDDNGDAVLLLRDGKIVDKDDEVSITYGDAKGVCEMIFSYGFIEHGMKSARELFLDLQIPDDDPLRKPKLAAAATAPGFKIVDSNSGVTWEGEYIWIICVNEEDGLHFKVLQTNEGQRELKAFWKDQELPSLHDFRRLLEKDDNWEIYQLRAVSILQDRVATQLQTMYERDDEILSVCNNQESEIRLRPRQLIPKLRLLEAVLLEEAYSHFDDLKNELARTETVRKYLAAANAGNEDEDYS